MADATLDPADTKKASRQLGGRCVREVMIFRDDAHRELRKHMAITHATSLYDALRREARGKYPRVAIAVGEIKRPLVARNCSIRWCPHIVMMSDTDEAAAQSQFAASGPTFEVWTLGSELDEVELRQQGREAGGILLRVEAQTSFR